MLMAVGPVNVDPDQISTTSAPTPVSREVPPDTRTRFSSILSEPLPVAIDRFRPTLQRGLGVGQIHRIGPAPEIDGQVLRDGAVGSRTSSDPPPRLMDRFFATLS